MGLQINLGLQQQLIVLIVSLSLGLHPSPLGSSSFSTRGLCPSSLGPSSFFTWVFSLYLASFKILIKLASHVKCRGVKSGQARRVGLARSPKSQVGLEFETRKLFRPASFSSCFFLKKNRLQTLKWPKLDDLVTLCASNPSISKLPVFKVYCNIFLFFYCLLLVYYYLQL